MQYVMLPDDCPDYACNHPVKKGQFVPAFGRIMNTCQMWIQKAQQRRALALLDSDQLNDIGLSREQALNEAKKPFWR